MSGAGAERTIHPKCGMTRDGVELFPQASGPTGFSVCMINGSQNGRRVPGSAGSTSDSEWDTWRKLSSCPNREPRRYPAP